MCDNIGMRKRDNRQGTFLAYSQVDAMIPDDHPLHPIREMANEIFVDLSARFTKLYASTGRPSIPPERLLRALLLQVLYSIRSERMLIEQLRYNMLFRWFVGINLDDPVWHPTTFTKNRERLLDGEIAQEFFERVVALARERGLTSDEHFTVDGTLIEAWASHKSFVPKDQGPPAPGGGRNADVRFEGEAPHFCQVEGDRLGFLEAMQTM